jgi:hypothetical protein
MKDESAIGAGVKGIPKAKPEMHFSTEISVAYLVALA